jgi:hypothetical protein
MTNISIHSRLIVMGLLSNEHSFIKEKSPHKAGFETAVMP